MLFRSCGKTVSEVSLPENAALTAIIRDSKVIKPSDHDVLSKGDELIFIATAEAESKLKALFIG